MLLIKSIKGNDLFFSIIPVVARNPTVSFILILFVDKNFISIFRC